MEHGGNVAGMPKTMNRREAQKLLEQHGWTKTKGG
jgi:hypothetical protein